MAHVLRAAGYATAMDLPLVTLLVLAAASLLGVAFTIVPVLPGSFFPLAGLAAFGALEGWDRVPIWAWLLQALAIIAAVAVDNVAQVLGVRRVGGSRRAMAGGAIGVVVGPILLAVVLGPLALLLGPPIGAIVGTLLGERSARQRAGASAANGVLLETPAGAGYRQLGVGALVAYVAGTFARLALLVLQVVVLVAVAAGAG